MSGRSIVIIGAGFAGLAAAVFARRAGLRTLVIERQSHPGGVAQCWQRGRYRFDGGVHFVMGHRPGHPLHELYQVLGALPACRMSTQAVYGRYQDEARGRAITVTADLDRLADELAAGSPADARAARELVAGARALARASGGDFGMEKPPDLMGFRDVLGSMSRMLPMLPILFRSGMSAREWGRLREDRWLAGLVEGLFLPESPVWFVQFLLGLLGQGQFGVLPGGSAELARAIEERARSLGAEFHYDDQAASVIVEAGRARGVRLAGGGEERADWVVLALDAHHALHDLLGGRFTTAEWTRRFERWPLTRPFAIVSFGLKRTYPDEPWLHLLRLATPLRVGGTDTDLLNVRFFDYGDGFAPPGHTVVQAELDTDWASWASLREDRDCYLAAKERLREEVLERLERHWPGLAGTVEESDVATPWTTWRYTRNHRGAYQGWLPTGDAMMSMVRRTLPGLDHLVLAGQWVVPGGGVPPVLHSGRHAIQIVCEREGLPSPA